MGFWIGIFAGGVFAWYAIRIRFYSMWVMLFNIVISVYLAVHLHPVITGIVAATGDTAYGNALTILAIATGVFLVLHGISYIFFTGQFNISFPKVFDILAAGFLGFWAGFLVWSFVSLLISITPVSENAFAKEIKLTSQFRQTNLPVIRWWCDKVHMVASRQDYKYITKQLIEDLLKDAEKNAAKSSDTEIGTDEKHQPPPPSEADEN